MKRGISLVALVITIIVLVILTGTVVLNVGGENSIIERARQSSEEYNIAEEQEMLRTKLIELKTYMATNSQTNGEYPGDTMANYFKENNIDVTVIEGFPSKIVADQTIADEMAQNFNMLKCAANINRANVNICLKQKNSNYVYEIDGKELTVKGEATREGQQSNQSILLSFNENSEEFYMKKLKLEIANESETDDVQGNNNISKLKQSEEMKETIKELNEIESMIYGARAKGEVNYANLSSSQSSNSTLVLSSEIISGTRRYHNSTENIRDTGEMTDMSFNANRQRYTIEKCLNSVADETYVTSIEGNKVRCNITKSGVIVMQGIIDVDMETE